MFKKENKKGECPKTQETTHKKESFLKTERKDKHAKTFKFEKMSNKNGFFFEKRSFKYVSKGSHRQRKQKKGKENKCNRNEKTRGEKRDNRWTNGWTKGHKEVTHACKKVINWRTFWYSRKVKLLFKKVKESEGKEKWVQEEGDQENKRSNKKLDEKRMKETFLWKKNTKNDFSKEIQFVKRQVFLVKKKVKKETKLTLKKQEKRDERKILPRRKLFVFVRLWGSRENIFKREK